ncbi:hypothetical protein [Uliginosibacterium sediminicola]|uniref:Uncharacterized protein n=1 Tax=Uliginosibacterium sediminicola TaxID=2024550 RepID=A0ABU9Z2M2_9RHOO
MRAWKTTAAMLLSLGCVASAAAADYSGVYDCKGLDAHEGPYDGIVTLERVPAHSKAGFDAYLFTLEVPGFGRYPGEAVAQGKTLAIHFALDQPGSDDHGTGLAHIQRDAKGRWQFKKFYFEPAYKGGNTGTETCTWRAAISKR